MTIEYTYLNDEIEEVPRRTRRRGIGCVIFFFGWPLLWCSLDSDPRWDFWAIVMVTLLFGSGGMVLHYLIGSVERFTVQHKDDVIVVTDQFVCLKVHGEEKVSIPLNEVSGVGHLCDAAGAGILYLESKTSKERICFSTHLNDFKGLAKKFDPNFEWPLESPGG